MVAGGIALFYTSFFSKELLRNSRAVIARSVFRDEAIPFLSLKSKTGLLRRKKRSSQ